MDVLITGVFREEGALSSASFSYYGVDIMISYNPPLYQMVITPTIFYDFDPPSPCGKGHKESGLASRADPISIHPSHAGRD